MKIYSFSSYDGDISKLCWEEFGSQTLGQCHDQYIDSDTLLLTEVFKSLKSQCLEIYELDTPHFFSVFGV